MRSVVIIAVVVSLALARMAAAAPTCYAGTEQSADAKIAVVIVRDVDPAAREIRTRSWRANAPHREIDTTYPIADDQHAIAHREAKVSGGTMITDTRFTDDTMKSETRFELAGRVRWRIPTEAKAFDCRNLDDKRAALDDSAPDASRTCFEGTQTILGDTTPAVVEQIVEKKRIVIAVATPRLDNRMVLSIDGVSITARNGHTWIGTGKIAGKPGAWTSYAYRARIDGSDVAVTGTLGGKQIQRRDVDTGRVHGTASLDADAFDCVHLEDRLAKLTVTP